MLFAIASDLHGHREHWARLWPCLWAERPDGLILCGDLGPPSILRSLGLPPGLPWAFCLGNCDSGQAGALRDAALDLGATAWGESGRWSLGEAGSVAFTHFPAVARRLAQEGHQAVFYGHTHRPAWEEVRGPQGTVLLANPGDVEGRYGRVTGLLWDSRGGPPRLVEA